MWLCTVSGEIRLEEIFDYVDQVIDDQSVVGEFFEIVEFSQVDSLILATTDPRR